ncbi:hypothetical protein ACMD2_22961 [Ananas comosus]|uniref:Uncharacterized protein n=1 Tax=Ananas comosus TaxID=4615 RepID=A0A199VJP0_ANACO|nr:hypothetical protein ACMD2_22961 [Ananas comosus]
MAVFLHHLVQRFHWELAEHDFPAFIKRRARVGLQTGRIWGREPRPASCPDYKKSAPPPVPNP